MGGAGTSKSTSSTSNPYAAGLAAIGHQMYGMAKPTMEALASQTQEGLQTGGVNAQIPATNAAVASAREAYSAHRQDLKNQLASSGLSGSSFEQEILGSDQASGSQHIAALPTDITQNFLKTGIPTVSGIGSGGVNAIATAGAQTPTTQSTSTPSFLDFLQQGLLTGNELGNPLAAKGGGGLGGGLSSAGAGSSAAGSVGSSAAGDFAGGSASGLSMDSGAGALLLAA